MALLQVVKLMSTNPTGPSSNVKVYDRPERKAPSPLVFVALAAILAILGFLGYRAFIASPREAPTPPTTTQRVGTRIIFPVGKTATVFSPNRAVQSRTWQC